MESATSDLAIMRDFEELSRTTKQDIDEMIKNVVPLSRRFFDKDIEYDERLKTIGEAISCTLMANNHRGGYPIGDNGIQAFKKNLQEDFGFDLEDYAKHLGFTTMSNLLQSSHMTPYVEMTVNKENVSVFMGRTFEDDLLKDLMGEIKLGQENQAQKDNRKTIERKMRMDAAKIEPHAVDGRLRIYRIIDALGGQSKAITYQSVQDKYKEIHGKSLNKEEIKSFFGTGEVLKALREYTSDDICVQLDPNLNGMMLVKLLRPLQEIEQGYIKMLEEAQSLPDAEEIAQLNRRTYSKKGHTSKQKKENIAPDFEINEDSIRSRNALLNDLDNKAPKTTAFRETRAPRQTSPVQAPQQAPKPVIKKANSGYTQAGVGEYTDESTDEEDESSQSLPTPIKEEESIVIHRGFTDESDTESSKPTTSQVSNSTKAVASKESSVFSAQQRTSPTINKPPVNNVIRRETVKSVSPPSNNASVFASQTQRVAPTADLSNEFAIKCYLHGFLRALHPTMPPVEGLAKKTSEFMQSQDLDVSRGDIESVIRNSSEFKFSSDGKFVTLKPKTRSSRK
ncbi:hypothetical protein M3Y97_00220600 [Aphelenchoides bicaudatus]|nr:hypothetical protein M3Y97_00220600 [Aphelenchoides bicaudatus]